MKILFVNQNSLINNQKGDRIRKRLYFLVDDQIIYLSLTMKGW